MVFWNSLAFLMMQRMLAIWSLVPLNPAWKSENSQFRYYWSLASYSDDPGLSWWGLSKCNCKGPYKSNTRAKKEEGNVMMEAGGKKSMRCKATSQRMKIPFRIWQKQDNKFSLRACRRNQLYWHLEVSPVRFIHPLTSRPIK